MMSAASTPAFKPQLSLWEMLGLVGQIGYIIAIPAFVFGFAGAYADKSLGTSPWLLIAGLALALLTSTIAVFRIVKRVLPS
jgi:F0F1-type ATP synthase assembly protein I